MILPSCTPHIKVDEPVRGGRGDCNFPIKKSRDLNVKQIGYLCTQSAAVGMKCVCERFLSKLGVFIFLTNAFGRGYHGSVVKIGIFGNKPLRH